MTVTYDKQRQRWRYNFRHAGIRHQGYCLDAEGNPISSKSAAKQAEGVARRMADVAPNRPHGHSIALANVVAELISGWKRQADWKNKQRYLREILQFFGPSTAIVAITEPEIQRYINFSLAKPIMVWKGAQNIQRDTPGAEKFWKDTGKTRSASTTNRHLAVLRLILEHAGKMRDPVTRQLILEQVPKFADLDEPKRSARPTPEPVIERLTELLPQHAIDALVITLCFGFRSGEAFTLQESQVDWHAEGIRLFYDGVKDKKDAFLPGPQFGMGYLRCLAIEAQARGVRHLISYRQAQDPEHPSGWRPIRNARKAWKTAMKVIEQEFGARWRWHDLRAAFITHIAMTAGPMVAQALARHADFDTTRAYIAMADEPMRAGAAKAADRPGLRLVGGSKVTH
jgi:integrase